MPICFPQKIVINMPYSQMRDLPQSTKPIKDT